MLAKCECSRTAKTDSAGIVCKTVPDDEICKILPDDEINDIYEMYKISPEKQFSEALPVNLYEESSIDKTKTKKQTRNTNVAKTGNDNGRRM
ncbi:hypothetical protein [Methanoplanus endosymbiosus]|uniref:Uncharacterized protein n=1 Tax=Methanoplanus endosymbiosus TaxID=33865 RepID=A0A9E7PRT9_9EURY|nr:hypothetical protein [Methanoplanus endosymbiosus]UUX93936.1 hypothetical protein L6E24_12780 [Methanoplanus endosymbiosus]